MSLAIETHAAEQRFTVADQWANTDTVVASKDLDREWLAVLHAGLRHDPYLFEVRESDRVVGRLPLALVQSRLFGRFLVSLPYLNIAGVQAENPEAASALVDRAVELADQLDVQYLELRHEQAIEHPALTHSMTHKVQMRLELPATVEALWKQIGSKVRNQVVNGEKHELTVQWGGTRLLKDFYDVFSRNMRDLGTPVYSRRLFEAILKYLDGQAELCVVNSGSRPIAAALLIHGPAGTTEVPSASSLRAFNSMNANMLMYWHLLKRSVERGQKCFDFGRSTIDGNTFRFKKQWGARPFPTVWQYYVRRGSIGEMRPENGKYGRAIEIWKRLPLGVTRLLGPAIVRGIP